MSQLPSGTAHILAVDDEPLNLVVLREILSLHPYRVTTASNGTEAWRLLCERAADFDLILLDRMMPDMDRIEVLRRLRATRPEHQCPVIMQTALATDADVAEGLRAGAYYYLTKPFAATTLLAVVNAALTDLRLRQSLLARVQTTERTLACLTQARFSFRTQEEARGVATLVATAVPNPQRVVLGLTELMFNAIEHGNLELSYRDKTQLIDAGRLSEELELRLADPVLGARQATVEFDRKPGEGRFRVNDQGNGFNWERYLDFSSERAFHTHGRGIAMTRAFSFDELQYQGCGNSVVAIART